MALTLATGTSGRWCPGCPGWPPGFRLLLLFRPRGLCSPANPSEEGGLEELVEFFFRPASCRSKSAICFSSSAICFSRSADCRTRKVDRGRRKADRGFGAATGGAEKELDQFLQTTFFRRIGWRAETSRPKEQEQAEAGWPTRTPGASPTIGSLRRGERHGGPAAEAMRALRRKSAARAQPGDYARRAAAASGDRGAPGEGPRHRVSVSERGLWRLRKGLARAAARGDQRGFWTAIDGVDRLLDGRLSAAAAAGGSHAGRRAGHPAQFGEYPESLGRSQPGGRTTGATIAGAVAARSGPECG